MSHTKQWPGYYYWKHFNIYRIRDFIRGTFTRLALKGHAETSYGTQGTLSRDIFTCRRPDVPDVPFHLHNSMLIITGNTLTYRDVKDLITEQFYASRFKGRPGHCYGTLLRDTRDFIAGHF